MTFQFSRLNDAKKERVKTKEEQLEEKRIALSIRIKPLDLDGLGKAGLKEKAEDLWQNLIRLETEKYDLEDRQKRQGYDVSWELSKTKH